MQKILASDSTMPPAFGMMHLLRTPAHLRLNLLQPPIPRILIRTVWTDHLPRVLQPATWIATIPPVLRRTRKKTEPSRWNSVRGFFAHPAATVFMLAMVVGSGAIHIINLRNDMVTDENIAAAKLGLLREVIERVQKGQDVDVEKELGTGDPVAEQEWADVMKEIESGNIMRMKTVGDPKKGQASEARNREDGGRSDSTRGSSEEADETTTQDQHRQKEDRVFF